MSAVPKLRFPEFDGEWLETNIGSCGTFYYGKSAPKWSVSEDAPTPCIRYGELYTKFGATVDKIYSRTNIDPAKLRFSKGGEVLVPRVGEDPRDFAKCTMLPFSGVAIGEMISVFETDQNSLFFTYYFNTMKNQFAKMVAGGNPSNLYYENLKPLAIWRPSLPEQQKIASFLSSVDKKIDLLRQKKDTLELYKKGLMQKIFSQEIRFKQDDGSDFPDWEEVALGEYSSFLFTNSLSRADLADEGLVQNIHYGDIHTRFSSQYDQHVETTPYVSDLKIAAKLHKSNQLQRGDVVIADASEDYADIGKAIEIISASNTPLFAGLHTIAMRPDSAKFTVGFSSYLFQSTEVRRQIHRLAQGAKVLGLSKGNIQSLMVSLPCLGEQKKIAEFISAVDRQNNKLVRIIENMETFKKGLLQQMFV